MKISILIILFVPIFTHSSIAQKHWTLRKCINYAIEHNLNIKQQEAVRDQNILKLNTAKYSRLPNLNGGAGQSLDFGRALQADNTYGNHNTTNSSFSLSTNIPLFTGLRIVSNIAFCKLNLKAAIEDLSRVKEDIGIEITSAYLQILFSKELAAVAHNQVKLSREQMALKEAFFKSGKISEVEVTEARSRVAQDEMSTVQADNNYQLKLLDLSQLLELPTLNEFEVVYSNIEDNFGLISLPEDIYAEAVLSKPNIKAAQFRLEAATKNIRIAQSYWYPQLSFSAGIATSYYNVSDVNDAPFNSQLHQHFNNSFQLSLSIPLFNRFETRNMVKNAHIQHATLTWNLEKNKKELFKEIQQAYYKAVSAESQYKSSRTASKLAETLFRLISEEYASGKATATEYNEIRTNWMKAASEMIQAKYNYLFSYKILDFYKGIPIS